jgi:hypothetical protein
MELLEQGQLTADHVLQIITLWQLMLEMVHLTTSKDKDPWTTSDYAVYQVPHCTKVELIFGQSGQQ